MGHLSFIGFENFRVFSNREILEFSPISILTGTNSSGKSSIFKAINLLRDNLAQKASYYPLLPEFEQLQELDFSGSIHKLGSFSQVLHTQSTSGEIRFYLPFSWSGIPQSMQLCLCYVKDTKNTLDLGKLTELEIVSEATKTTWIRLSWEEPYWGFYINFKAFRTAAEKYARSEPGYSGTHPEILRPEDLHKTANQTLDKDGRTELKEGQFHTRFLPDESLFEYRFHPETPSPSTQALISGEIELLTTVVEERYYPHQPNDSLSRAFQQMSQSLQSAGFLYRVPDSSLKSIVLKSVKEDRIQIIKNRLEAFLTEFIIDGMQEGFQRLTKTVLGAAQLGSVRANVQRFYTNESQGTEFNSIIYQFLKAGFKEGDPEILFTNKWLNIFEIADELEIERDVQGVGSRVFLIKGGKKILLADLGYGVTQFLPILFKISILARDNYAERIDMFRPSILLIEEPETNLHPRFQSLLSDLFWDATNTFNMQFVIETHSEYVIRKFQFLVAQKTIPSNKLIIYYLNNLESLKEDEQQVMKMYIQEDGELSQPFGRGFVDESARLIGEIWKANNL